MRQPSHPGSASSRRPEQPPSVARSITLTLLLVGVVLAASFPQVTAAVLLGAVTASLYHRLRQRRGRHRTSEQERPAAGERTPVRAQRLRNGSD